MQETTTFDNTRVSIHEVINVDVMSNLLADIRRCCERLFSLNFQCLWYVIQHICPSNYLECHFLWSDDIVTELELNAFFFVFLGGGWGGWG